MNPLPAGARFIAALVFGCLLPLGLAPFNLWPSAILSVALLGWLLQGLSPKQVFRASLGYGLGLFGVGVSWVFISMYVHGGESIYISGLLTALLVGVLALIFALTFSVYGLIKTQSSLKPLLAFPSLWVIVEWIRGWLFTGFPWLYLGNSFIDTWLAGWAPIGGVLLLSFIGAFSGAALVQLLRLPGAGIKAVLPPLFATSLWIAGIPLNQIEWTSLNKPLSVGMIQPALTPSQKWNSDILYEILIQLRRQSVDLWDSDLLIWPESAIPVPPQDVTPYIDFLDNYASETNTALITGIPLYAEGRYFNSVMVLGEDEGTYSKRHLVPFGEYIPLEDMLRGLIAFFDRPMSSFSAGANDQPLFEARGTAIASAICYEIVYQDLVAASARKAELILTLSNDVWFGDSIAPHQHLQMARLRAIENRKPVVRSTNDGISAIIDHRGQIRYQAPQFIETTLRGEVTPASGVTPFSYWRSWPVVLLSFGLFGYFLTTTRRKGKADGMG